MIDQQKIEQWRQHTEAFGIADIRKAMVPNQDLQVGVIILTMIAIDFLGGYLCGRSADKNTFTTFVKKYLPSYSGHVEQIWTLRCGLVHDYITDSVDKKGKIKRSMIIMYGKSDEPHLIPISRGNEAYLALNRVHFAKDFLSAWDNYLKDLSTNPELYKKFAKRVNSRGFLAVIPI